MVSNITSNCAGQICRLGYEFCEVTKGVCRRCEDFKDTCFMDNQHISNCSTYCTSLHSCDRGNEADDTLLITVIVLVSTLFVVVVALIAIVCLYCNLRKQNKTVFKSNDTEFSSLQTVSDNTSDQNEEVAGQSKRLLDFQDVQGVQCVDSQPQILKQIPTTNDRGDNPKLMACINIRIR